MKDDTQNTMFNQANLNIEKEHILNLKRIYESENESLHKADFIDEEGKSHPNCTQIIAELIELDFIETENDENTFFLTTAGYDFVEGLINREKVREVSQSDVIKPEQLIHALGAKKVKKYLFIWLVLFGASVAVYKYYFPNALQNNKPQVEIILTDEALENIKQQAQQRIDSIKKSNKE